MGRWYQTSRKHRMIARLPDGKSGIEALTDAVGPRRLSEALAGDQFLRVHARGDLVKVLHPAGFAAFRRHGGGTYAGQEGRP